MTRTDTQTVTPEPALLKLPLRGDPCSEDLLLPANSPGVPKPVADAEQLVRESMVSWRESNAAVRAATEETKAAARLDTLRDSEAVAAGNEMPEDRLVDQARKTLTTCLQRQNAELETLRQRQLAYGYAVSREHAEWSSRQADIVSDAEAEALRLHSELGEAIDRLTAARSIEAGLADWPVDGGHLEHCRFYKRDERWQQHRREQAEADIRNRDEQNLSSRTTVDREPLALLAALKFEIVGRAPAKRVTLG